MHRRSRSQSPVPLGRGYLAELDPIYLDCIIRRWQAYAKDDAILAPSGETFDEVAKKRREENARISLTPEHEPSF